MSLKVGIILNGPPGCGKDTIARKLPGFVVRQFKDALYEKTAKHFAVDLDRFVHFASSRDLKDSRTLAGLGGRTPREALIHVSERVYKPQYGNDYFGKVELNRLETLFGHLDGDVNVVYPDGGFIDEVICTKSFFDVLVVVRLHRDGFDFSNDSRDYIQNSVSGKYVAVDLHLEEGEIAEAVSQVLSIYHESVGAFLASS